MAQAAGARGSGDGELGKARRVALITGITGQDGSYLAEFLSVTWCSMWYLDFSVI
uniref:GDP-mannose 4,6-dehydratase n=1 Tax=Canis lupus familiaris TaxID=9615 RepID=A0A8C0LR22_CANLF